MKADPMELGGIDNDDEEPRLIEVTILTQLLFSAPCLTCVFQETFEFNIKGKEESVHLPSATSFKPEQQKDTSKPKRRGGKEHPRLSSSYNLFLANSPCTRDALSRDCLLRTWENTAAAANTSAAAGTFV